MVIHCSLDLFSAGKPDASVDYFRFLLGSSISVRFVLGVMVSFLSCVVRDVRL